LLPIEGVRFSKIQPINQDLRKLCITTRSVCLV
jgi:hypothetical protein